MAIAIVAGTTLFARPHGGPGGGPRGGGFHRPPAPVHHGGGFHRAPAPRPHHHHSHSVWGHGGRHFWPGFAAGVVGAALYDAITPPPVVVNPAPVVVPPAPVVQYRQVWVEGRYVDQVQPNGAVIRVWQPGHYEQRQVYY